MDESVYIYNEDTYMRSITFVETVEMEKIPELSSHV